MGTREPVKWFGLSLSALAKSSGFLRSWYRRQNSAAWIGSPPAFILWSPIFLAGGIGCYFALPVEPSPAFIFIPGLIAGVAWFLIGPAAQWIGIQTDRPVVRSFLAIFALFFAGLGVAQYRSWAVAEPVLPQRLGPVWIEGQVSNVEIRHKDIRLTFDPVVIEDRQVNTMPRRVRIVVRQEMDPPVAGQRLRVRAVLHPPSPPVIPGGFDFQRRAYFEGLGAVGYSLSTPFTLDSPLLLDGENRTIFKSFSLALSRLRQDLSQRIGSVLPGQAGAIATALLTGRRGGIDPPTWSIMRDSGLAHLLAISGLHMGMVAAFAFWLSRAVLACYPGLALRQPIKKWAALSALLAAFVYLVLTGAPVPTQRAYAMTGLVLLAILTDRVALSLRLVAVAALIILILTPESLLKPGFQMSFAAVTALVAAYAGLRQHIGDSLALRHPSHAHQSKKTSGQFRHDGSRAWWVRNILFYVAGIALSTIVATVATAPFALYHFNRLAVYGLLANLISVPITAFWVMPCGFLALLLMPFGLEAGLLSVMGYGISVILEIAEIVAGLPGAAQTLISPTSWGLVMMVLGGLWLCLWHSRLRWLGIPAIILGVLSIFANPPPDILVDDQARLIAVRLDQSGNRILAVSSARRSQRIQKEWLRRTASKTRVSWSGYQAGYQGMMQPDDSGAFSRTLVCDSLGCIYEIQAVRAALILDADALSEDCRRADIVIALVPVIGPCPARFGVIDRFDMRKNGTYAVWLDDAAGQAPRILSVADKRGRRPWVVRFPD